MQIRIGETIVIKRLCKKFKCEVTLYASRPTKQTF